MKKAPAKSPRKKGPLLLWVIDPWDTLDHVKDTTLRLAEEALALGARCFLAESRTISLIDGRPHAEISEIIRMDRPRTKDLIFRTPADRREITGFDHLFYRTDPPVDLSYWLPLQILSYGTRTKLKGFPKIHSPVESLFFLGEKWAIAYLGKEFFPKSIISSRIQELSDFVRSQKKCILKPLYFAQSKGVKLIDETKLLTVAFQEATDGGKVPVILQEFLPGITAGEIRLWFSGGKLISAVKKLPKSGESIIDMDRGGSLARVQLEARDKKAVRAIEGLLKKEKILFAAVDLIDGKITDFNHTSPGLIVPMEDLLEENLAKKVLKPLFR